MLESSERKILPSVNSNKIYKLLRKYSNRRKLCELKYKTEGKEITTVQAPCMFKPEKGCSYAFVILVSDAASKGNPITCSSTTFEPF
jgi:hypothetical protein